MISLSAFVTIYVALTSISIRAQSLPSNMTTNLTVVPVTEFKAGKNYIAGIRSTRGGKNFCLGALISPSHVLTTTTCITHNIRWVSLGSNTTSGTSSGEQIKVVAMLVHPQNNDFRNDFLILELALATDFKPVMLDPPKSIVKSGMKGGRLGWNDTTAAAVESRYMQSVEVTFVSNKKCSKDLSIHKSNFCSRGYPGVKSCMGDKGGAIIVNVENLDILVGLVSSNEHCGQIGGMNVYSRVSAVRPWIDSIISNICVD
ncbi:serine protease family [Plasmopara halstedii]|uniref:Serine protease family n=1 Tax=Plasmopara halstedii TaxID=4781 RepID=A0A0P1B7S2_PLAHL|nr:serine protease family [Plasmopara halstedii]CEG49930.1 serine protease family [Plasmopara halstedii]|eukprot:XP_024586299.1 serine protease family [Plasmopara halstedii]